MATDIAFVIGILVALGLGSVLKSMSTIAVVDLIAILIISCFIQNKLNGGSGLPPCVLALCLLNYRKVTVWGLICL
jgi:Na+/H+ antiporter NhaA